MSLKREIFDTRYWLKELLRTQSQVINILITKQIQLLIKVQWNLRTFGDIVKRDLNFWIQLCVQRQTKAKEHNSLYLWFGLNL